MAARLVMAAVVWLAAARAATGVESADEVVQRVQQRYDTTKDFTANVRQEMQLAKAEKTLTATGSVAFKRGGLMRWTLENHDRQVIVADGKTLWFYEPDEQQVLKAPFQVAFRSTTPISFLTGVGRIAEDFKATVEAADDQRIRLSLLPRHGDGELGQLQLTVAADTYDIIGAEVRDPLGNVTRLELTGFKRNTGLADELFQFSVPAGVDVIEAPIGY